MNTVKRRIIKLFQLVFSISMFLIFGIALSKPLNNLIPQRMIVYTLFWVVLFGGVWWFALWIERKVPQLEQKLKYFLPVFLTVYAVALYGVSSLLRSELLTDYQHVYEAALHLARGEEVTNWDYFARWYNNVGCMLALAVLFSLGNWLPDTVDVYYLALFFNVLQVVLVIACLYYLIGRLIPKHVNAARFTMLVVSVLWIPIWANTSIFYSDQMSFGAGVFGVTLLVKGWEKRNWYVYLSGAGVIFVVGMLLKVTVGTILIALLITGFLFSALWKNRKKIAVVVIAGAVVFLGYSLYCKTLPYQETAERFKTPIEYWLAMGLGGNGTYASNWEFAEQCEAAPDYEARQAVAREYIRDNIGNLWDVDHILGKVRQNFGCGDMGAAGYFLYKDKPNLLWNWFSQEGTYYWKYACLSTSFFFAVLFFLGAGGLVQFLKKEEMHPEEQLLFGVELAFWGLCLFLMLWEAQDKQLYNHSGWMMLSLVCSLQLLGEIPFEIKKRRNTVNESADD